MPRILLCFAAIATSLPGIRGDFSEVTETPPLTHDRLAGPSVKGGVVGKHPSLADLDADELKFHTDFRRFYATVLDGWLVCDIKAVHLFRTQDVGRSESCRRWRKRCGWRDRCCRRHCRDLSVNIPVKPCRWGHHHPTLQSVSAQPPTIESGFSMRLASFLASVNDRC